jgi:hypothetical protein
MKAVVKEKETVKQEKKYPYLGIYTDNDYNTNWVVFFTSNDRGVLVWNKDKTDSRYVIGFESNCWGEHLFTPFTGSIELSND